MNQTGSTPGVTNKPAPRSEQQLSAFDTLLQRVRGIRNEVVDMETRLFGGKPSEDAKSPAIPKEIFSDTVVGNQDRLLSEIRGELNAIEAGVAHLREYA